MTTENTNQPASEHHLRHQRKTYDATALVILAALFLGVMIVATFLFRGARIDLTQNQLYTIAPGTKRVLGSLEEPINLYFFFSQEPSRGQPELRIYAQRVRELLEEMAQRSNGKLHLTVIDPQPFSDEEDRATQFGLMASNDGQGQQLYFGLAGTNSTDGKQAIEFFQKEKEEFLEYDVASLIYKLAHPKRPTIGLLTSLPMDESFDQQTGRMRDGWAITTQLREMFTVRSVPIDTHVIDKEINALFVVHPKNLSPATLYAIDQYVLRGGKLLAFVDPSSEQDAAHAGPMQGMGQGIGNESHASTLGPLFKAWGIDFDPSKVLGDQALALTVAMRAGQPPVRHLAILALPHASMNAKDVVTANLNSINVWSAGILKQTSGAKTSFESLLSSSNRAAPIDASKFAALSDPQVLLDGFAPTGEIYTIAARVHGTFRSAFPDGPPQTPSAGASAVTHLQESAGDANVVVVADTDLLANMMWLREQNVFGQRYAVAVANNGDFVANLIDNLTGSADLISVRGRQSFFRPFTRVERLRERADQQLRAKEQDLNKELQTTEAKLLQLQSSRQDQSSLALTPEQEQELKRFQQERGHVRKELRDVRHTLNVGIENLGTLLKAINIGLIPLLLSIAAIAIAVRRRRRFRASRSVKPAQEATI
jgi:ABC-type uncharacterized transport system involved in gliding motility auxiliary subunit